MKCHVITYYLTQGEQKIIVRFNLMKNRVRVWRAGEVDTNVYPLGNAAAGVQTAEYFANHFVAGTEL